MDPAHLPTFIRRLLAPMQSARTLSPPLPRSPSMVSRWLVVWRGQGGWLMASPWAPMGWIPLGPPLLPKISSNERVPRARSGSLGRFLALRQWSLMTHDRLTMQGEGGGEVAHYGPSLSLNGWNPLWTTPPTQEGYFLGHPLGRIGIGLGSSTRSACRVFALFPTFPSLSWDCIGVDPCLLPLWGDVWDEVMKGWVLLSPPCGKPPPSRHVRRPCT